MRAAFVAHSYRERTAVTEFFAGPALSDYTIDTWWDDRWKGGAAVDLAGITAGQYDLIVVFEVDAVAAELASLEGVRLVFVPSWDGRRDLSDEFWGRLANARIVSFCHALHEELRRRGFLSGYFHYVPDPAQLSEVSDFGSLRGFFYQRVPDSTWESQIRRLAEGGRFARFHVHQPHLRESESDAAPAATGRRPFGFTWPDGDDGGVAGVLAESNVFFAPCAVDSTGLSFIDAMAMGMCVVGADRPTMNEYLTHGVSGLLWTVGAPRPLDFSRAAELGRRAREQAAVGHERWLSDLDRLREFVSTESREGALALCDYGRLRCADPSSVVRASRARLGGARRETDGALPELSAQGGRRTQGIVMRDHPDAPLVTVATVALNAEAELEGTLVSTLSQDYPNLEVIVVDGGSSDGTLSIVRKHETDLDLWVSGADSGPFDAMNRAAQLANGRFILFMNAGDWFASSRAVSDALRGVPPTADFIIGHHVYRQLDGVEELHKARDFEQTWRSLTRGELDLVWLDGVPAHQATFTRTRLLRAEQYDLAYRIAADHEFMYRQRRNGAHFHHSDTVIAVYASGGFSWNEKQRCFEEWLEIASRYGPPTAAEAFFGPIIRSTVGGDGQRDCMSSVTDRVRAAADRVLPDGTRQWIVRHLRGSRA